MPVEPLHVISGGLTRDAALDTAISRAILQRVSSGELPPTLQVGMPHRVVAFGKHDTLSPGFAGAMALAQAHGFDVTVRIAGGRAVVFHPGTVRFAWTVPVDDPTQTMHARFKTLADAVVATLARFEVSAEVGELPDEYCAGRYSVHLTDGGKVMGVGQRLARSAAQVGGMIVVNGSESIKSVLVPIYRELGIPMDPKRTGALSDVVAVHSADVADELVERLVPDHRTVDALVDPVTMALAASLRSDHVPQHLRERAERP